MTTTTPRHATPIQARALCTGDTIYRVHVKQADEPVTVTEAVPMGRYGAVRVIGTTPSDPVPRVVFQALGPVTTVVVVRPTEPATADDLSDSHRALVDGARWLLSSPDDAASDDYVDALVDLVAMHVLGDVDESTAARALLRLPVRA